MQSNPDAVFEFNKQIIDATKDLCVAYKINTAFYEAMGVKGWEAYGKNGELYSEGILKLPMQSVVISAILLLNMQKHFLKH